jgi:glutathione reductase (NADPH)
VRRSLAEEMRKRGIDLRVDACVARLERHGDERRVILADGTAIATDAVLYATGRRPLTAGLGLERVGVATGPDGAIVVDEYSRTSVPSVWAIGDVTDRIHLTPVAIHEAMARVRTLFGGVPTKPDHEDVASAVFSQPPVATVGLTEAQARERHGEVVVFRSTFRPLKHTLTGRDELTRMKLVVERASDRVVGAHMVGPDAAEIVQGLAIAVKMKATKADFDAAIGIHPTAAEEFVTMREPV